MPVRINNVESDLLVADGESAGTLSAEELQRVVGIVMERIREERALDERIAEETAITNKVSRRSFFD